jgi:hypothetical protein
MKAFAQNYEPIFVVIKLLNLLDAESAVCTKVEPRGKTHVLFLHAQPVSISMIALCIAVFIAIASAQTLSICDRYSIASDKTDQTNWIQGIVVGVFTAITTGPPNDDLRYFNGAFPHFLPVSTNFTDPNKAAALGALVNGLVAFFGGSQALGCSSFNSPLFNITDVCSPSIVHSFLFLYFFIIIIPFSLQLVLLIVFSCHLLLYSACYSFASVSRLDSQEHVRECSGSTILH